MTSRFGLRPLGKRGQTGIMKPLIMGFAIIILIVMAFALVLGMSAWKYVFGIFTTSLANVESPTNATNISYYSQQTFGQIDQAYAQFKWLSWVLIFGMIMGIIILSFLVRVSPAYFFVYLLLFLACLMISIFIARGFENVYNSGTDFSAYLQTWGASTFVILHLPVFVTAVGLIGCVPMFVNLIKNREEL